MNSKEKIALATAKKLYGTKYASIEWGYRQVKGKRTKEKCLVIGVHTKHAPAQVAPDDLVPSHIAGVKTDVQKRRIFAPPLPETVTTSLTSRLRPCPPGYSIGHRKITAGTLGAWVQAKGSEDYLVLSNNHILANSNDCAKYDEILQPGPHDGGIASDLFARLEKYVLINWDPGFPGCNFLRRLWPRGVKQPYPNRVDAALAKPLSQEWVQKVDFHGVTPLVLGDSVAKVGRTTEVTDGTVIGEDARVVVDYGGPTATFDGQIVIQGDHGDFSQGGDSGSIVQKHGWIGGLLFAGGSQVTIVNPISDVIDLLDLDM